MKLAKLLRNLASVAALRVFSAGASLALTLLIAQLWGAERLGSFSVLFSLFLVSLNLPLLGLHAALMRDVAARPGSTSDIVLHTLCLSAAVALLACVPLGAGGVWFYAEQREMHGGLWLLALSLVPSAWICVAESTLLGQERMHVMAGLGVAESLARTLGSMAAVALGFGLTTVAAIWLGARVLLAVSYWLWGGLQVLLRGARIDPAQLRYWLRLLPPYFGLLLLSIVIQRLDLVVLSRVAPMQEVGVYASVHKLFELGFTAVTLVTLTLVPSFAASFERGADSLGELWQLALVPGLVLAVPILLSAAVFAGPVIGTLYGAQYAGGAALVPWFSVALIALWIHQMGACVLQAAHRQGLDLLASTLSGTSYLLAMLWVVPRHGAAGAAVIASVLWAVQAGLRLEIGRRVLGRGGDLYAPILQIGLAAAVLLGILLTLREHPALALSLSWFAYGALLLALGVVPRDVLRRSRALLARAPA